MDELTPTENVCIPRSSDTKGRNLKGNCEMTDLENSISLVETSFNFH